MKISAEWLFPITSPPLQRHVLEIENGVISRLKPADNDDAIVPGSCILPGLVNAHTHLAYTALRNLFDHLEFFPWIRKLTETKRTMTEEQISLSTRMGILESLKAGITTVADMSDLEVALRTLSVSELRGTFYYEVFGVELEQAKESLHFIQETLPRLRDQYASGKLAVGISPHACYTVRPELYRSIAKIALRENLPVSFHLAESKAEEEFISKRSGVIQAFLQNRAGDWQILGSTSVSHIEKTGILETRPLLAHLVQVNASDIEILKRYEVAIAHCPKSNAKFGHGIAPLAEFDREGFRIGVGTDSAASNNRLDLFEEGRFALLQQHSHAKFGPDEQRILELMTLEGARALGMERQIGSIEIGKTADLLKIKVPPYYQRHQQVLNHLIYNTTVEDITNLWIAGKELNRRDISAELNEIYTQFSFTQP